MFGKLLAVALGFRDDDLEETVHLHCLYPDDFRKVFQLDEDDEVLGASWPVQTERARKFLEHHAYGPKLNPELDWFAEFVLEEIS